MQRALLSAMLLVGCAHRGVAPTPSPAVGAEAWANALRREDAGQARALLNAEVTRRTPAAEYERRWRESGRERARQAEQLTASLAQGGGRMVERATVRLVDGTEVELVHDADGWRLESPLLITSRVATVQDALRILALAIERRDAPAFLHILAAARREGVATLLDSLAVGLRAHLTDAIEIQEGQATLEWTENGKTYRVVLVNEENEWRIWDLDVR